MTTSAAAPAERATDPTAREDEALLALLRFLERKAYRFVVPTPATHARVVARADRQEARSIRDVLGWSLPFRPGAIDAEAEELLQQAGMLREEDGRCRSAVRVASLAGQLFLHSAYPTREADAVFFGPDSYRFADLIRAELPRCPDRPSGQIVDIGTGSGVGAIVSALACPGARVQMTDVNPLALRFAHINAAAAGIRAGTTECSNLDGLDGEFDIVTANPPYIIDPETRLYRDGGGMHGGQVSLDMARMALDRLAPGGRLILYTGSAIVDGEDALRQALHGEADIHDFAITYRELDPDIFGEELEKSVYRDVERIALVAAVVSRPA